MSLVKLLKKKNKKALFTTPSHSQKFCLYKPLKQLYKIDISETETHNPQAALKKAQDRAKKIYKTASTLFLTNGSTSGIIVSVLSCVSPGEKVLIWRDAHPCHINAVKLAGGISVFYDLNTEPNWGIPMETDAEMIEHYLKTDDIKAVIVTSPTYEGIVSDIRSLKKTCDKYNAYLIVDEAHGALYPFSTRLPESAVNIADFTIQSLHKTAGGVNPTALLHTTTNLNIEKALKMINTTSPSYPLLASIEANINYLNSWWGRRKLDQLLDELEILREECPNCEFFGDDLTKILVKVPDLTGEELSEILFDEYNIEDEKTNPKSTMLLCGIGTNKGKLRKLKKALNRLS